MTRIATFQSAQSALLNLQAAQSREMSAATAVSSGRKATDLAGFGRDAEGVTALKSMKARLEARQTEASTAAAKLEAQDLHLNEMLSAANEVRTALGEALALGRPDGLVGRVEAAFGRVAAALNAEHAGRPLFAGARTEEQAFNARTMAELAAGGELFGNDTIKAVARVDEGVTVETGELASEIAAPLMERFAAFQARLDGGGFSSPLTEDDRAFLGEALRTLAVGTEPVTAAIVRTGAAAKSVENAQKHLDDRSVALEGLLGERTEVDMAQALTELQHAQVAVQATAQVVSQLRGSSLLQLLK